MGRGTKGLTGGVVALVAAVVATGCGAGADAGGGTGPEAAPDTSRGEQLFQANCAVCHGESGLGTANGPPLIHEVYEPGHHPDASFHQAVTDGVVAHHWDFGNMPPVPGLDRGEVDDIVAWVREQQRAAGIE